MAFKVQVIVYYNTGKDIDCGYDYKGVDTAKKVDDLYSDLNKFLLKHPEIVHIELIGNNCNEAF